MLESDDFEPGPSTSRSRPAYRQSARSTLGTNGTALLSGKGKKKRLSDASGDELEDADGGHTTHGEESALLGGQDTFEGVLGGHARDEGAPPGSYPAQRPVKGRDKTRTIPLHASGKFMSA